MADVKCPKCDVPMNPREVADTRIDVCPRCAGFYLDEHELGRIRETGGSRLAILDAPTAAPEAGPGAAEFYTCPKCLNPMERHPYLETAIQIDSCPVCGGVWLDAGEFTAILDQAERVAAAGTVDPELLRLLAEQKRQARASSQAILTAGGTGASGAVFGIFRRLLARLES